MVLYHQIPDIFKMLSMIWYCNQVVSYSKAVGKMRPVGGLHISLATSKEDRDYSGVQLDL